MQWELLVLLLAGLFSGSISLYLHKDTNRLKYLGLLLASFFFVILNCALILRPFLKSSISSFIINQTIIWAHVYCIALILSALLLFVRESKPEFSRFPITYVIFPIFIILSYVLVYDTVVLKDWLMNLYQAGAVVVAVLMYGIYNYRESIYRTAFIGSLLFLLTFILYLLLPKPYTLAWQILLTISILTLFSGYYLAEQYIENQIETQ